MVLTAFRGPASIVAASATVVPQSDAPAHTQLEAPVLDHTMVGAPALFETISSDAPAFDYESRSPIPFGPSDAVRFDFYKDQDPDDRIHTVEAYSSAFSDNGSSRQWEAPLPSWDYSHSEWPELVGPSKPRSRRNLRSAAIAAAVFFASAAGLYLLIFRPSTPTRPTATDSGTTTRVSAGEPRPAAVGSANSATPAASGAPAGAAPAPEAAASNDNSARGRFSLQAAAFPTQDGADEFAEKLKRAGVPSYVVPAELARRGRWFRVRVGRFNSDADAQMFAGEAQLRARAARLAVQLIVCPYDQP